MTYPDAEDTGRDLLRYAALVWEAGDIVEIRPLPVGTGLREWTHARDLGSHLARMMAENSREANLYAGVLPRTKQGGGSAEHTDGGRVLWADFDGLAPDAALTGVRDSGLPPPMLVVDSGHGTHVYWKLNRKAGPRRQGRSGER